MIDIHTHTHRGILCNNKKNASSITPQNKTNLSCKCIIEERTLDRKWVHVDGLEKQTKHIYAVRSQVELILRRALASDHRVCLRPRSVLLGTAWCPLSCTGCWIYRCAQLWKLIKSVLKTYALFCMWYSKRKVNRKLKWSITVYSHSCAFGIRKIKCASWNIYHWKQHIFLKKIYKLLAHHGIRQTFIDLHNHIRMDKHIFALGAISGFQNTLRAISLNMESNKNINNNILQV